MAQAAYKNFAAASSSTLPHLADVNSYPPQRILSIDILRGLTMALMIVVNDPGDYNQLYPALRHADWNGCTPADLVFPNFLFLSGASLVFSIQPRIERSKRLGESTLPLAQGLLRRSINLFLLKIFIAALPTFRFRRIRIFGVLFRTVLCSLMAGLILMRTLRLRSLLMIIGCLLAAYNAVLRIPFRLSGKTSLNQPFLDPDNNLAAFLDRKVALFFHGQLHTGALYNVTHDPEGLLSSASALATVLIRSCAALVMRDIHLTPAGKFLVPALAGANSLGAGYLWHRTFPINKNLQTSSYVLSSAGWSLLSLAVLYLLYDVHQFEQRSRIAHSIARPAYIFGANALVAYALSIAVHKIGRFIHVRHQDHSISLRTFAYRTTLGRRASTPLSSLGFAAAYAALIFLPNLFLWYRKIFVKI